MDLIDRDAVKEKKVYSKERHEKVVPVAEIDWMPNIEAVPLDKLCEWLARNAFAFECKDCEEYCRALLECENEVGSDPEYWKNKLTKWMEGLDAAD